MPDLNVRVFEVNRASPYDDVRIVGRPVPEPGAGEILLEMEHLGVATNNLAYVLLGDRLGHGRAFPAQPGWGRPPT